MKRLMIVADHSFVVQAIRLALRQTAGFQVVGFFDGRGSVRNALTELRPDVVLVDDMQETENALERLREVAEEAPQAKSLLLTLQMDAGVARAGLRGRRPGRRLQDRAPGLARHAAARDLARQRRAPLREAPGRRRPRRTAR